MIAHIQGKISFRSPAYIVIDCQGVGYGIQISFNTYSQIGEATEIKLLTHLSIKEDTHTLYGFMDEDERVLFQQLISVTGVGTNTARLILSSLKPQEIKEAIFAGNWALLKTIKGIGPKTAQRLVIDLQDKVNKTGQIGLSATSMQFANPAYEEALAALLMLGFNKVESDKALQKIRQQNPEFTVEQLVKNTLKIL